MSAQTKPRISVAGMAKLTLLAAAASLVTACLGIPDRAEAVKDFSLESYLGTWYEIARLDHRFERGLSRVKANYSLREDGGVEVINSGYNDADQEWKSAEGKAYFIGSPTEGRLKVSFFGPFYGAYNIIELDPGYQYALVVGPDTDYLWVLSRTPQMDGDTLKRLLGRAEALGFDLEEVIYVDQS